MHPDGELELLTQHNHAIAYHSQALCKGKMNDPVIQLECLAMIGLIKKFRHYLIAD